MADDAAQAAQQAREALALAGIARTAGAALTSTVTVYTTTTGSFVEGETPAGLINSANVTYTLAHSPIAGSVKLYRNGQRLIPTTHFSFAGSTVTMVTAPDTGDTLLADYRY